ncbi:hypothetical protein BO82DRAFT_400082 [Aspergillus uvarum CBS 121591]|uniref:Amino acid transporter transmembrane domain-containing protein n=1 Tax=Aspergillus uvarum CBS 121591 TaxID=1448315 RepID=A0A319D7Z3_9EURO|nr:hypothetical protein BO82DRAFT_400082 [Aspergillus uvarum CBS 121591]PYH84038.1 hypothetical protein BO82DRAFT_400082 [Aspergillus uvarum CBS 121591]
MASAGLLSGPARGVDITETVDATALFKNLASVEYSAVEVTAAFCKRAAIARGASEFLGSAAASLTSSLRQIESLVKHVGAKYAFVRLLRDSRHLQANTLGHWFTWLGINFLLGAAAFIVAEAVPVLNYLLALASAVCFAPFSLVFPPLLWMYDQKGCGVRSAGQKVKRGLHAVIVAVGILMIVGGIYSVAISIRNAFADGDISRVFDCRDNSGFSS